MGDQLDTELDELINKINGIQNKLGHSKVKAGLLGDDGKVDRFAELKLQISERLTSIREVYLNQTNTSFTFPLVGFFLKTIISYSYFQTQLLDNVKKTEGATQGGAKDAIECQSKIRTQLSTVHEEWVELDRIFQAEARKRKVCGNY